jgi:hypothetical protein
MVSVDIDVELAHKQHKAYVDLLRQLVPNVIEVRSPTGHSAKREMLMSFHRFQ